MTRPSQPLRFLFPSWFALVMGQAGLALAWHRASPQLGDGASAAALVIAGLAALTFVLLLGGAAARWQRHRDDWTEDLRHPVRHAFVAALPVSVILLATVGVALFGANTASRALWWLGGLLQLVVTVWVVARWWRPAQAGGLQWASATPALLIPIVGNVLVPLAGVPLGHAHWAAAQFGVGLMFWPVVLTLLVVRLAQQGPWPERLRPAAFILIAPPAVVGLAALQFGAPEPLAWALWGMAIFGFAWASTLVPAIARQAFGLPHWALSFPLAALAALTLRLGGDRGPMAVLGLLLLALASLVVAGLLLATVRGLRDGSLLAPEPVATIAPAR